MEDCSPCSPAGRAGLRAGDFVMEVNGIPVRQHETAAALIKASQGRTLRLGVLCLGPRQKLRISMESSQLGGDGVRLDRKHKALEFNRKVLGFGPSDPSLKTLTVVAVRSHRPPSSSPLCLSQVEQILGDEPEVKEKLFSVLKQYAAEKSVEWLASVLPDVLVTEEHRELLSSIR